MSLTPPPQVSDMAGRLILTGVSSSVRGERTTEPPSPPTGQRPLPPPLPRILPSSIRIINNAPERVEVKLLKLASNQGRLQDIHQILSQYLLSQVPDIGGRLHLGVFYESVVEAILHQYPSVLSYLFFMRVGEPQFYTKTAIEARSHAIFQVFLEYGWNINEPLERTMCPALGYISHDRALTEWFLDNGADPNARCSWDFTPMSEAMCQASLDTIKLLFERGGSIEYGQLLHNAVQRADPDTIELIGMLLDKGLPINDIQYKNHAPSWRDRCLFGLGTPLHYAAQDGRIELVSFLLSRGADAAILDTKGRTALQLAENYGEVGVIQLLRSRLT